MNFLCLNTGKKGSDVFEEKLPGSGLLIYRIDQRFEGNADGPPEGIYVYRPN